MLYISLHQKVSIFAISLFCSAYILIIVSFSSIEILLSPQRHLLKFGEVGFEMSIQPVVAVIKKFCSLREGNFHNFGGEFYIYCLIELVLNIT